MPPKFRIHYNSNEENASYDTYFTKETLGFRTKNSSYFKSLVTFINNIVEYVNFKLSDKGIRILSMDKGHVALVDCFIPNTFFSNYSYKETPLNQELVLGINTNILMKILNHLNHDDELIFDYRCDTLNISFINKKYKKFYTIKLMDIDSDYLEIVTTDSTTGINIESKYFHEIINDFNDIGENVRFIVSKERNKDDQNIELECSGDMTGIRMVLSNGDLSLSNLQDISLEFALKNLILFAKGANLNKYINIEIDNNFPLKLSYQIMETGYLNYFLAPRIED